jgi:uncharacterized protein YcaQ
LTAIFSQKYLRGLAEKYFEFCLQFINNYWFDRQTVKEYFQHDGIFVPPNHFNLCKFRAGIAVLKKGNELRYVMTVGTKRQPVVFNP